MAQMRLATFVIGPDLEGRGYRVLAGAHLPAQGGWQGNLPLVLLEWAKLRSASGFAGRFPVSGGVIAVRGAYLGEASAGPVAFANGIFVADGQAGQVLACERALFGAIPQPTQDIAFGERELDLACETGRHAEPWKGLGLAWQDRHIIVEGDLALDDVALAALESVDPPVQHARIRGWCTTCLLEARGDFLPIQSCNLLVTRSGEPSPPERFRPAYIRLDGSIGGDPVSPPPAYRFWRKLAEAAQRQNPLPDQGLDGLAWRPEMADWTDETLAWHYVEVLSQHRLAYAAMVDALLGLGAIHDKRFDAAGSAAMARYLEALRQHPDVPFAEVAARFRDGILAGTQWRDAEARQVWLDAWNRTARASGDTGLIARLDAAGLLDAIEAFDAEIAAGTFAAGQHRDASRYLRALQDRSDALAGGRPERRRQGLLSSIRWRLGEIRTPGETLPREEVRARFRRRLTMPPVPLWREA